METIESYYEKDICFGKLEITIKNKDKSNDAIIGELANKIYSYSLDDNMIDLAKVFALISNEWKQFEQLYINELNKVLNPKFSKDKTEPSFENIRLMLKQAEILKSEIEKHGTSNIVYIQFKDGEKISNFFILQNIVQCIDETLLLENVTNLISEIKLNGTKILSKDLFCLNFTNKILYPLFEYLKHETLMRALNDKIIYYFIKDFCIIAGVDWDMISTQEPDKYLKKAFNTFRKRNNK